MSTVKTVKYQVGTDGTSTNNFTIYQPDPPDGTMRVGNGNADAPTDVAQVNGDGFKFTSNIQIGTDATSSNNFTIYQPATPDGTLRIGVGNADSPTEVGQFNANGYKPATAPAFRAKMTTSQTVSATTWTKLSLDDEDFDTTSDYDATTNYRFTPSVEGYYMCSCGVQPNISGRGIIRVYKNGSATANLGDIDSTYTRAMSGASLVYLNGTTDYIEFYVWRELAGDVSGGSYLTTASAILIQQA